VSRYLLDTNLLVYLHDRSDPARRRRAARVIEEVARRRTGALPVQALTEFAAVALRKFEPPLPAQTVRHQIERLRRRFPTHPVTYFAVEEALRGVEEHQLSYFDAQIWAVARLHQIPVVISEDARGGSVDGVSWLNPFVDGFDAATL
jgi:predicted nucleic acid-binding protein